MELIIFILIALLGLCVGSFLNVVIYRTPIGMKLSYPPSHCTKCNHALRWFENIPLVSYLALGGKCRVCKNKISPRYFLVEFLNLVLWLGLALVYLKTEPVVMACYIIASSVLLVVAFIDFDHKFIPDRFQIILLLIGVVLTIFASDMLWSERLIGFFVGGGIMLLFYGLGYFMFKREAMGIGDIKLMAVCGLLVGWQNILLALFLGVIVGAVVLMIWKAFTKEVEFAFAPFLAFGIVAVMFFGKPIIDAYLTLLA